MISQTSAFSVCRQCKMLNISRSLLYYRQAELTIQNQILLNKIDELYTEDPTRGTRRMRGALRKRFEIFAGRRKIARYMSSLGIAAIYPKRNLSLANQQHEKYPYLLRGVKIDRVNQVWSTDITYIRLKNGFVYLTAVMDWHSRFVLSWRLSITLDKSFCIEALGEALEKYGKPEIFNTDQGSQYTSEAFTGLLKEHGIKISMDGKGRALDNIFVERLWRTVKYEDVYLKEYGTVKECKEGLREFFKRYNSKREHQSLDYNYPEEVYFNKLIIETAA